MGDLPPFDPGSDFVRSLVRTARSARPPRGAKARAITRLGGSATKAANGVTIRWLFTGVGGVAAVVGVVAWVSSRPVSSVRPDTIASTTLGPTAQAPLAPPVVSPIPATPRPKAAATAPSCKSIEIPDREPTTCSTDGRGEELAVVNTCGEAVDVLWVDFKCRESFVGRVEPGATLRHYTFDTHAWRVRDHLSHRLLKEWVGPRQPDEADASATPPRELPDVVIRDGIAAPDAPPVDCSRPSARADMRFVNRRSQGVSVIFWVSMDCKEEIYRRLEPGESWVTNTHDAHNWRVRDEAGALLMEVRPEGPDETVYVTVP